METNESGDYITLRLGRTEADDLHNMLYEIDTFDQDESQIDLLNDLKNKLEAFVNS